MKDRVSPESLPPASSSPVTSSSSFSPPNSLSSSPVLSPFSQQYAWDRRYSEKGRQWGNAPTEFSHTSSCGTILELGVGDGKNLRVRGNRDAFFIGLDFSPAALCICRSDPQLAGVHLLLGDACYIPLRSSSVDLVYAHHILGHLSSLLQPLLIEEVFRVLKPRGMLALTVFASGDMREGKGEEVEASTYIRGDGIITRYFTPEEISHLGRFIVHTINREEWPFPVRGKKYVRAVLTALLEKPE
nr:class I SAM-dependent methyltransferase [uncultured Methanospirillum sp.]